MERDSIADQVSSQNFRRSPDSLLRDIAEYVHNYQVDSVEARETAKCCLMDSLGCALLALNYPACTKLLGPVVPGATLPFGARVPGTAYQLDPVQAAFNIGTAIRWLDFNDTWLAAEWGHPSDNLGGILAVADYLSLTRLDQGKSALKMSTVLDYMIKAYEIQGIIALENSFNSVGLDHVILVRIATTAVVTALLGGDPHSIVDALSNAWLDGGALRTYRHAPNTGFRKSWAAGDATRRGVQLALMTMRGEMGYPSALTAEHWGFYDAIFNGKPFRITRPFASYVMENILFKVAFPAEFHGQTAIEAALKLHDRVVKRLDAIERVEILTQRSAMRIINKTGPLHNPADRDHCLQYMVTIALIFGRLTAGDYEDSVAADPRIDQLRDKTTVVEDKNFSIDYLDPEKRSIGNAVQVSFKDGSATEKITIEFPIGHRRRRDEGIPLLKDKFKENLESRPPSKKYVEILAIFDDQQRLESTPVNEFIDLFVV